MIDTTKKEFLLTRIDKALDGLRPHLMQDGGDVELIELTNDYIVRLKWIGNCRMCSMSEMTLRAGIEQALKSQLPEIQGVEAIAESV